MRRLCYGAIYWLKLKHIKWLWDWCWCWWNFLSCLDQYFVRKYNHYVHNTDKNLLISAVFVITIVLEANSEMWKYFQIFVENSVMNFSSDFVYSFHHTFPPQFKRTISKPIILYGSPLAILSSWLKNSRYSS